ncbi:MAG: ATP-dependent RecD-like DNA helicase [Candidatus Riflebacteria bacterium]|nr:ATP-dependent RecD-like DNA helicase [Candidatus Riflebacteria bacterium]
MPPMDAECLTIQVERITYTNPQNGYSVLRASSRGHPNGVVVVGTFGVINPGEELRVYGTWTCHPQFGVQFHAFRYTTLKPATLKGIEKYLGSGMIKGIGPVTARRLVATFGLETLDVIERQGDRLTECPGIGPSRAERIALGWAQQKAVQDVMIFLQGHGISPAYAVRIFRSFGSDAVRKVAEDPYVLAYEISGIGFKTADKIAAEFGITGTDPRRVRAGLMYLMRGALDEGHLFLSQEDLARQAREIMQFDSDEAVEAATATLLTEERLLLRVWQDRRLLYLPHAFHEEQGAVNRLVDFLARRAACPRDRLLTALDGALGRAGLTLTDLQALAVERSLAERFLVITGGPGTGKTTTLRAVVEAHLTLGRQVALASPTGRAAKRLAEVTGHDAKTIHRLLEFSPQDKGFRFKPGNPLPCDTLIVDEASMIDMSLFFHLLRALPNSATFVLVGDADQLPSVGPGLVLQQLIASDVVPVVRLETVFRQAEASHIITNAHRINRGQMPVLLAPDGKTRTDCYFLDAPDPDKTIALLKNVVTSSLPKRFGYDPIADIQVLTPMNRASLGAAALNATLQEALNPPSPDKPEMKHMARVFRQGDKVIQLKNNYDLEVFNGDIGLVREVNPEDQEIVVAFPQGEKVYQPVDLLDLGLAYAITIHKSQGSEYPAVVLLLTTQHYVMLQRNLLYTGLTRARKTIVLLGTKRAVALAVKNAKTAQRNTLFRELLMEKAVAVLGGGGPGGPASGGLASGSPPGSPT